MAGIDAWAGQGGVWVFRYRRTARKQGQKVPSSLGKRGKQGNSFSIGLRRFMMRYGRHPPPHVSFGPRFAWHTVLASLSSLILPVMLQLNNKLSFGQHWVWKQMTVGWSGAKPGGKVLDVCCGSGDIAFLMARAVGPKGQVTGLDFAAEMLDDAAKRQKRRQAEGEAVAQIE